jgi:putative transposase
VLGDPGGKEADGRRRPGVSLNRRQDGLIELFCTRGVPEHIRSDNGPEFTSRRIRRWLEEPGARTLFIAPGSPWEIAHIESFNGKLRDELLKEEVFHTLQEAQVLVERWGLQYNRRRPRSSLGNRPPAPEAYWVASWGYPLTPAAAFGRP